MHRSTIVSTKLVGTVFACLVLSGCGRPLSLICQGTVRDYNNGAPDSRTAKPVNRFVVALQPYENLARTFTKRFGKVAIYQPKLIYLDVLGPHRGELFFGDQEKSSTFGRLNINSGRLIVKSGNEYYSLKCMPKRFSDLTSSA